MKIEEAKELKIAILIRNFDEAGGGAERYCVELCKKLSLLFNVHVFSQNIVTNIEGIEFHHVRSSFSKPRFLNQLQFSYRTKKMLERLSFDIVHSHDIVTHANVYTVHVPCFKTKFHNSNIFKLLISILNMFISPRQVSYLYLEKKAYQTKNQIIAVSQMLATNILACYPNIHKPTIAYPGIHPITKKNNKAELRSKYGFKDSDFLVLFVANGYLRKGLNYLIESIEKISKEKISLVIIGDGNKNEVQFSNKSIMNRTYFFGKVDNISEFYSMCDILAHPTNGDTFGMAPLEAMSNQLPVILPNKKYCGISETLTPIDAIILERPDDINAISKGILNLFQSSRFYKNLSLNGYKFSKKMSWQNTLNQTLKAYERILSEKENL